MPPQMGRWGRFKKIWLSDPATYPLFVVIAAGGGICGYHLYRMFRYHPQIRWDPRKRGSLLPGDSWDLAETHQNHAVRRYSEHAPADIFTSWNAKYRKD